jgi:hypothetical protein
MRRLIYVAMSTIAIFVVSCEEDYSYEWKWKPHATSPSGWCTAYVQKGISSSRPGWSAVELFIQGVDRRPCSGGAVDFRHTDVPVEMRWLDQTTLEVRYPKEITPSWPCPDVPEHVVECGGRRIRVLLVKI